MAERKSYAELLRDPRWQRRRLEILNRSNFTCEYCGNHEDTLHVHHLRYRSNTKPWEYPDADLKPVCQICHEKWHLIKAAIDGCFATMTIEQLETLMGAAMGLCTSRPKCSLPTPTPYFSAGMLSMAQVFSKSFWEAKIDVINQREVSPDELLQHRVEDDARWRIVALMEKARREGLTSDERAELQRLTADATH